MELKKKWHRLKRLSPSSIPSLAALKISRAFHQKLDRLSSSPKEKSSPGAVSFAPLWILHPDVFKTDFGARFKQAFPEESKLVLDRADRAIELKFDLLGSGPVDLKNFAKRMDLKVITAKGKSLLSGSVKGLLPWHYDFKSGIGWDSNTFFSDIRYGHIPGVDVKVPWELSRCAHFISLGQAYVMTGDEKYTQAFLAQIGDWLSQNKSLYGVNWSCAMDVALRACNWLLALEFFRGSPLLIGPFQAKIYQSLEEHGRYVFKYREWNAEVSSNHYLSDLLGLFYMGTALKKIEWRDFAITELKKEILNQTYTDGLDYEGSLTYHKLVSEIFLYFSLSLSRQNRLELKEALGSEFFDRFKRMLQVISTLSSSDGRIPLIGDNDSGRIHPFLDRADADARFLTSSGERLGLTTNRGAVISDPVWIFGFDSAELKEPAGGSSLELSLPASGGSGLLVLGGAHDHLVFSAQPNGTRGLGNHTHNDKLSVTLSVNDEDLLIDPGSGLYTAEPAVRNRLRSTSAHNTVEIDGKEQNDLIGDDLFSLEDQAPVHVEKYTPPKHIVASHDGYQRLSHSVRHTRTVERQESGLEWTIIDEFSGRGDHSFKWNFALGPNLRVIEEKFPAFVMESPTGHFELRAETTGPLKSKVEETVYSPAYGILKKSSCLRFSLESSVPQKIIFHLFWKPKSV